MSYNLKVKRENGSFDEINFSFRLNNLEATVAFEIKDLLKDYPIIFNKPKNSDNYVILFEEINEKFDTAFLLEIIEKFQLNEKDYGFWISISSEYGHGGGYVPMAIKKLYTEIGGEIDFSYMIG